MSQFLVYCTPWIYQFIMYIIFKKGACIPMYLPTRLKHISHKLANSHYPFHFCLDVSRVPSLFALLPILPPFRHHLISTHRRHHQSQAKKSPSTTLEKPNSNPNQPTPKSPTFSYALLMIGLLRVFFSDAHHMMILLNWYTFLAPLSSASKEDWMDVCMNVLALILKSAKCSFISFHRDYTQCARCCDWNTCQQPIFHFSLFSIIVFDEDEPYKTGVASRKS